MGSRVAGGERVGRGWARSLDFDGISPYQTGDDVRWIHWRATARSGRVQVRRFAAESHRARMIVVDLHPALCFGTRDRLMAKTAALVAARLSWEALATQEPVGLALGAAGPIARPRRGKRHVMQLLERLRAGYAAAAEGGTEGAAPSEVLEHVSSVLRYRDEICLISDFGEIDLGFERRSAALADVRTLRAFVVEDPLFRSAVPAGRYPMRDPTRQERETAVVAQGRSETTLETVGRLRKERRRRLEDCGWLVADALDILPQERRP